MVVVSASIRGRGTSAETIAERNYNAFIAKAKAESEVGDIVDPNVYRRAANLYLRPFLNDPRVQKTWYDAQASAKVLEAKINDADFRRQQFDQTLTEQLYKDSAMTMQHSVKPENLVLVNAFRYDQAATALANEIAQRRRNLQSVETLVPMLNDLRDKTQRMTDLYNDMRGAATSGAKPVDKNNYGLFLQINPDTGKIISAKLDFVDSVERQPKGFVKTGDNFGVPVYLNTYDENQKARLGDKEYEVRQVKDAAGKIKSLAITDDHIGGAAKIAEEVQHVVGSILPVGKQALNEGNIKRGEIGSLADAFQKDGNLPKNGAFKDSKGNYYALNKNGQIYKGLPDQISQLFGVSSDDVRDKSYFLSQDYLKQFPKVNDASMLFNTPSGSPSGNVPVPSTTNLETGQSTAAPTGKQPLNLSNLPSMAGPRATQEPQGEEKQQNTTENITKPGGNFFQNLLQQGKRLLNLGQ